MKSVENALLRVTHSAAQAILEQQMAAGQAIDLNSIIEMTLADFQRSIDLREHLVSLRTRLLPILEKKMTTMRAMKTEAPNKIVSFDIFASPKKLRRSTPSTTEPRDV